MEPRILSNLWQVGGPGFSSPEDAAIYLVRFGDKGALIDAGCGNGHEALTSNISRCIPETVAIEYLLVTHCHYDHTGGAESGDSQVTAASWYGADMRPLSVDIKITGDAQSISIGEGHVAAYHWPGHSPGSLVYTTKMEDKTVLFGQDVHGPLDPSLLSDPEAYQTSLKKLLELDADILCEGHFGVYHGKRAVQRFIRSFMI